MPRFRKPSEEQIREWQPRFWAKLIGLVLIVAYVIAFIVENHRNVHLHFVLFTAKVSQIWLILLSVVIGALAGALLRQLEPQEVAALGARPAGRAAELALERLEHRIAPLTQQPPDALEVRLQQASAEKLEHRGLGYKRRCDVGRGDDVFQPGGDLLRKDHVADAETWGDRLRER